MITEASKPANRYMKMGGFVGSVMLLRILPKPKDWKTNSGKPMTVLFPSIDAEVPKEKQKEVELAGAVRKTLND